MIFFLGMLITVFFVGALVAVGLAEAADPTTARPQDLTKIEVKLVGHKRNDLGQEPTRRAA